MVPVIQLSNVTKRYDSAVAVNQLNLEIFKGEVFGLLGPNGAGKTTTILMMLGLTERSDGHIKVLDLDPMFNALEIKKKVGYMPDDIGFYDDRTAIENLVYTAMLNGIKREEARQLALSLLVRVGLEDAAHKVVSTYSRGMRQRLGLADVLIKQPQIIILDEPTLGIDPEGVREFLNLITVLSKEEGITVLLSSHHLQQVQQICDRVGLFVKGQLLACGRIDELAKSISENEDTIINVHFMPNTSSLKQYIDENEHISRYEYDVSEDGMESYVLICKKDMTAEIAKKATEYGNLLLIQRHQFGLDDIYHRYFTGGHAYES